MRVALARALFISPSLLLLDEPTNHLDLEACVWLEDYLSTYPKLLIVVSHSQVRGCGAAGAKCCGGAKAVAPHPPPLASQDFLNGVCTNMMVMQQKKLRYWGGNYDTYVQTRAEQDKNQMTLFKKQQVRRGVEGVGWGCV